jgi:hypothetical protein
MTALVFSSYEVSTMKYPDFVVQGVLKRPDFEDVLKICKCFLSDVKGLLLTTEVKIPAYIFRLPKGPPLGSCYFTQRWCQLKRRTCCVV